MKMEDLKIENLSGRGLATVIAGVMILSKLCVFGLCNLIDMFF